MRLFRLFPPAAVAILLLADGPARAQQAGAECVGNPLAVSAGNSIDGMSIRNVEASTRAGHPCQFTLGVMGENISALEIIVRPAHGILGAAEKEENRRYVAYMPQAGFVGHDRFEIFFQYMPTGRGAGRTFFTRMKVEMNVAP